MINLDSPLVGLLLRFALTLIFNAVQLQIINKHSQQSRNNVYSFFIISIVVFFLAHTLGTFEMQLGMAIGMFAVFGIVRYRTETLKPQEMTYLFSAIGIAVINALSSNAMGWSELIWINLVVLVFVYILERFIQKEETEVTYKKINVVLTLEELADEKIQSKMSELETNMKISIARYQVSKIDYALGTAQITLYYED